MTTSPKLTPRQLEVLRELCKPQKFLDKKFSHWYFQWRNVDRTALVLFRYGLLSSSPNSHGVMCAYATPQAHALLAEIDEAKK